MINLYTFFFCVVCFLGGSDSNKGKSKKWRKILQFPHISQCIHLKEKIGKFHLMFSFINFWFLFPRISIKFGSLRRLDDGRIFGFV